MASISSMAAALRTARLPTTILEKYAAITVTSNVLAVIPRCLSVRIRHSSSSSSSGSSTGALAYKALHRRINPLPTSEPPAWSASAAVSSILYETPLPSSAPPKRHVLNLSGILAARGFNIDSLVVCNTEVPDLSRMTIVLSGLDGVVEQARRQLEDLVPVWAVLDYTAAPLVQRELLLAKISILGPEYFEELLAHHREITAEGGDSGRAENPNKDSDYHPSKLPISQALRHKHQHLQAITQLTHQFGGKISDISENNCIVELAGKPSRLDAFMKLIAPFGILESARTGLMALPRSPLHTHTEDLDVKDAGDVVDASSLPPG
ncbi:mitochondrial acetolactate synthase-like protein small subunit [Morchella snyderi]|nr:mitochondrial acetolactate synthase-like protein small subunit [Morchella snyderi]